MKFLFLLSFLFLSFPLSAQIQQTFCYEIRLLEPFQPPSSWQEKEHLIQKAHMAYLDSLTQAGYIELAGVLDQQLENQVGMVILNVNSYEKAKVIALNDPSVKNGMMEARVRPMNIYFKRPITVIKN